MKCQTLMDLVDSLKGKVTIEDGRLKVLDAKRFREELLDQMVINSIFSEDREVIEAARWIIREVAAQSGIIPASIQSLYEYKGKGGLPNVTIPAINVRGLTYDVSRAIVRAAKRNDSLAFIFEIARSEIGYTHQRPAEYATCALAAALREGHEGPIFIQGDHFQVKPKAYKTAPDDELQNVKDLIRESIEAGFYNIDIDTSTLVDLSKGDIREQQRLNFEISAQLAHYIREQEPEGITISIGGEIGEVGGKNSTEEELREYLNGFNGLCQDIKGLSKVSIQTGTTHGGVPLPDGTVAKVKLDFDTLEKLSRVARDEYGLAGAVQHGASTLPPEAFHRFPETDTAEVHLATEFQNMIYERIPDVLRTDIYEYLKEACAGERKEGQTDEQFIYKVRKKGFGPYKEKFWDLPASIRSEIGQALEDKFDFLFKKLNAGNTSDVVKEKVNPVYIPQPIPEALGAALGT